MSLRFVFAIPVGPGGQARLHATLASLAAQSADMQIALCHAGEKDAVEDIVAPFRRLIAYERHGPDGGQSAAINEGWRALDGDVYGWLNADDCLAPGALSKVADLFAADPDADIVCGQSLILDAEQRITGLHPAVRAPDADLFRHNMISQPSCFIRRDALKAVDYVDESLHYVMDWDLWVRLMENRSRFVFTPDILSAVLWDEDTKTASLGKKRRSEIRGVVSRLGDPVATAKCMIGFTIHHLTEYSPLSSVIKPLRARLAGRKHGKLTFWGGGEAGAPAQVQIFHFAQQGAAGVELSFTGPGERLIQIEDEPPRMFEAACVRLAHDCPPAAPVAITYSGAGVSAEDLDTISWILDRPA